jgi:glycosyltransferase involved in cell wall biosynthesis
MDETAQRAGALIASPVDERPEDRIVPGRTPLVVIGDDWNRHVSTSQHLFRHAIGRFPLVWINSFGHRRPTLSVYDAKRAAAKLAAMMRKTTRAVEQTTESPDIVVNPRALPWHNLASVRALNAWSLRRDIRGALAALGTRERPLVVSCTPAAFGVIGQLNELASIYFCLDDYGEIHGTDRDLLRPLEEGMGERVDAMVATAASLTISRRPRSGRTLHLPQGVNYEHFAAPRPVPPELAVLPRPIIGFAGGVGPAVDFDLLRSVARRIPAASLVLVGPLQQPIDPASLPANVHVLGPRPYAALPAYVQAFDVGLVPYVHNDWTRAVDPLKLLEYLAAGIPVVTTGLPEASKYAQEIWIRDGADGFVEAINASLAGVGGGSRQSRQALASLHRWEARFDQFLDFANRVAADVSAVRPAMRDVDRGGRP